MSDGAAENKVWLYEDGEWSRADDPVPWSAEGGDDVLEKYAEAGYTESPGRSSHPFLALGLHSEESSSAARFTLYVRHEPPQCLIDIEGASGSTRVLYAARLPDGLDLLARWAPIAQAGTLTAFAEDLVRSPISQHGVPVDGFVESVTRRVARTVS